VRVPPTGRGWFYAALSTIRPGRGDAGVARDRLGTVKPARSCRNLGAGAGFSNCRCRAHQVKHSRMVHWRLDAPDARSPVCGSRQAIKNKKKRPARHFEVRVRNVGWAAQTDEGGRRWMCSIATSAFSWSERSTNRPADFAAEEQGTPGFTAQFSPYLIQGSD